jgi:hypothetical protein
MILATFIYLSSIADFVSVGRLKISCPLAMYRNTAFLRGGKEHNLG